MRCHSSSYAQPTLVYINNLNNINITKLHFKNAPKVFHSVTGGSSNVVYDTLTLDATPENVRSNSEEHRQIRQPQYVTIKNIKVTNQDDCMMFKPGVDYMTITNITCTGSHGILVGSLGGGAGSTNTVTNVYVTKATMVNSTKAVGIKLYQGGSSHGIVTIRNMTFNGVMVQGREYAAQIQSCYGSALTMDCNSTSINTVNAVYFILNLGATSTEYDPVIADLDFPAAGMYNIYLSNFNIKCPTGKVDVLCSNVDGNMGLLVQHQDKVCGK
ncbi:glycoside hydrolase family 28 protein [Sphaerobolus stellatus SS14]|uniref:Glycoside hydrolase family 28 protein n=1 Tax=Sphaerobolus stellatus (strain SS14) TaxID=990650 RepID=A0A0C9VQ68_SPHS4|nr:glycoside hydrolase family 28 protein [Sphaerobolus stellatus SS14]